MGVLLREISASTTPGSILHCCYIQYVTLNAIYSMLILCNFHVFHLSRLLHRNVLLVDGMVMFCICMTPNGLFYHDHKKDCGHSTTTTLVVSLDSTTCQL